MYNHCKLIHCLAIVVVIIFIVLIMLKKPHHQYLIPQPLGNRVCYWGQNWLLSLSGSHINTESRLFMRSGMWKKADSMFYMFYYVHSMSSKLYQVVNSCHWGSTCLPSTSPVGRNCMTRESWLLGGNCQVLIFERGFSTKSLTLCFAFITLWAEKENICGEK